jgi:hypothetical protein
MECGQKSVQSTCVRRLDTCRNAGLEKFPQAFVPEGSNHGQYSGACRVEQAEH